MKPFRMLAKAHSSSHWRLLSSGRAGLVLVLSVYLASVAVGGRAQWQRLHVPAESPTFLDMRSITTAWDCERRGIDPLPLNPCDSRERPANFPRLWLLPGRAGLGEGATVPLSVLSALAFFVAVLCFVGPLDLREGAVLALALCSPAVMLGVERGNVDLLIVALVASALMAFRARRPATRLLSHGMFLLAAVLKIFPLFSFVVLARQRRRWLFAAAAVVLLFLLDVALTFDDLLTIRRVVPQEVHLSYGAGVLGDAVAHSLHVHLGWPGQNQSGVARLLKVAAALAGAAVAVPLGLLWRGRFRQLPKTVHADALLAGGAIFVGSYILLDNYDYRLACLVLTMPQLLRCARRQSTLLPVPRLALTTVLLVLLFAARASYGFPFEEAFNWLLFVYMSAVLVAAAAAAAGRLNRSPSEPEPVTTIP